MRADEGMSRVAAWTLVAVATLRATVAIAPQIRFDTDPGVNATPYVGFGPTGSLVFDAILLAAAAFAFTAEARAGRRVHLGVLALAALPGVSVLWHGFGNALDLFRGATWLAAAIAGVAAMHLARDGDRRRLLIAGCVSVVAMLVIRGAEQIWIEHAATVREFELNKQQIFAQYGWDPLGAAARSYERRLRQPEATGWFALANLFSAAMAFGVVFFGTLAVRGWLGRVRDATVLVATLLTIGAGTLLVVNGSKGAIGVTLLGAIVAAVATSRWKRFAPWIGLAVVVAVAVAPAVRGLLSEGFANERSLLFRAHYLEGALRAIPESMPLGLGPDGFQDAYVRLRPERSPEEVMSTHAMLVDWLVLLGPLGLAWVMLVGRMLARPAGPFTLPTSDRAPRMGLALLTLLLFAVGVVAEAPILGEWWLVARLLGLGCFAITFLAVDAAMRTDEGAPVVLAALGAGLFAVVAQAQIEMIFFQPGMVAWVFVLLGGVAALPDSPVVAPRRLSLAALVAAALASIVIAFGVAPQYAQDRRMDEAIAILAPLADVREAWPQLAQELQRNQPGEATRRMLDALQTSAPNALAQEATAALAATKPAAERLRDLGAILARFESESRTRAADMLLRAREAHPTNWQAERAAIDQLLLASRSGGRLDAERPTFAQAMYLADAAFEHWRMPRFAAVRSDARYERARARPAAESIESALAAVDDALALEPYAVSRHVARGDLFAASGRFAEAITAWRRALAINANRELDPLMQMSEKERAAVEARIQKAEKAATENPAPFWPLVSANAGDATRARG